MPGIAQSLLQRVKYILYHNNQVLYAWNFSSLKVLKFSGKLHFKLSHSWYDQMDVFVLKV